MAGTVHQIATDRDYNRIGNTDKKVIFSEHLGSTDVITDIVGGIEQSMSFDPWGQRSRPDDWSEVIGSVSLANFDTSITQRGFTGHEQLDEAGLIHMGGRIYDAKLARFLQPDPFIQAPGNTQSYNRYSYVWNNPLNATDPSGYFLKTLYKKYKKEQRRFLSKAFGADVGQALVLAGSAFCGPMAPVCAAAGTYEMSRAHGASSSQALRASAVAGASVWAFAPAGEGFTPTLGSTSIQVGVNLVAARNPELGQAFMFISGNWDLSPGDWVQNAVGSYAQYKAQEELERVAARMGLSLQEFNLFLALNSKLGLKIAGTTYDQKAGTVEGFTARRTLGSLGVIWDMNDTLLNAQGLLDAVSLDVVANMPENGHLQGHSLGAWRVNNLVRQGFLKSGDLRSLPGLTVAAAGTSGVCSNADLICGGAILTSIQPGIEATTSPTWWSVANRNHRVCSVSGYREGWAGTCR